MTYEHVLKARLTFSRIRNSKQCENYYTSHISYYTALAITYKRGSALTPRGSTKLAQCYGRLRFLWKHAIFMHPPTQNLFTNRYEVLNIWLCWWQKWFESAGYWLGPDRQKYDVHDDVTSTSPIFFANVAMQTRPLDWSAETKGLNPMKCLLGARFKTNFASSPKNPYMLASNV